MTYRNSMVLSIFDANKNPIREFNGIVYLPHESNYHVYLKNTTYRRARAEVFIDGAEVTNGGVIINARDNLTLSRFLNDGDLDNGAGFKFVALDHPGVQDPTNVSSNGIVKVKFWLEKRPILSGLNLALLNSLDGGIDPFAVKTPKTTWVGTPRDHVVYGNGQNTGDVHELNNVLFSSEVGACGEDPLSSQTVACCLGGGNAASNIVANGATASGAEVSQHFNEVYWGGDDEITLVEIELKLIAPGKIVKSVVDYCAGCGKKRFPKKAKFCTECGDRYPIR